MTDSDVEAKANVFVHQLIGKESNYSKIGRERRALLRERIKTALLEYYRLGKESIK